MAVVFCAFGFAKAQETQVAGNTLTLTLDKALEIALDENPTMKVAAEEIALKKVAGKEAWQSLLPEASIAGSVDHTIKAAEMKLNDMSFKMGQDRYEHRQCRIEHKSAFVCAGCVPCHVNDKDRYRTCSREVARFQTGFGESGK